MGVVVKFQRHEENQMLIVNDVFLKIINNIDKYKIGSSYFSWIKKITQNTIIDHYRKEKKYHEIFRITPSEEFSNVKQPEQEEYNGELEAEDLLKMIYLLPTASRLVFNLYAIEGGYNYQEVGDMLGITKETVKWHLKNARKILREKIITKQKQAV